MIYQPKCKTGYCSICGTETDRYKYCKKCSERIKREAKKKYSIDNYNRKLKTGKCHSCGRETSKYKYCEDCYKKQYKVHRRNSYLKNKEKSKKYAKTNRKQINEYRREYYKNNKQKLYTPSSRIKLTSEQKRNKRIEYAKLYYPIYFKNNPSKKIAMRFRQRLWRLLKGIPVKYKMEELIGCTERELKIHIEGKFKEGMSWTNHSNTGWHIDHIISCFKFDLTKDEELKKCFNYTNLQPLWAKDNQKKGKK